MKVLSFFTAFVAAALAADAAWAQHSDVEFSYEGGAIAVEFGPEGPVFESDFGELLTPGETDEPGFGSEIDEGLGIDPDDIIAFNIVSSLLFWDGSQFASPGSASIEITDALFSITTVDATSGTQLGNPLGPFVQVIGQADAGGDFHEHIEFALSNGTVGAYGFKMTLSTDSSGIADSPVFGILFNNGLGEAEFEAGVGALASMIPEPTSGMLLAVGAALFGTSTRRRLRNLY